MAQGKVVDIRAMYQIGRAMAPEGGMAVQNRTMDMFMNYAGKLAVNWLWDGFEKVKGLKKKNNEELLQQVTTNNMQGPVKDLATNVSLELSDEESKAYWKRKFATSDKKRNEADEALLRVQTDKQNLYGFTSRVAQDKTKYTGIYGAGKYVSVDGDVIDNQEISAGNPAETQSYWSNFATGGMDGALHYDRESQQGGVLLTPGDPMNAYYSDKIRQVKIKNVEGEEIDMDFDFIPYEEIQKPYLKQVGKWNQLYDDASSAATKAGKTSGWNPVVSSEVHRVVHNAFNGSEKLTGDEIHSAYFDGAFVYADPSNPEQIITETPAQRFIENPPEGATLPTMDVDPKSDTYGQIIREPFTGFNEQQHIDQKTKEFVTAGMSQEEAQQAAIADASTTKQGYMEAMMRESLDTPFYRKYLQKDLVNHTKKMMDWSNGLEAEAKKSKLDKNAKDASVMILGREMNRQTFNQNVLPQVNLLNSDQKDIPEQTANWKSDKGINRWKRVNGQDYIHDGSDWVKVPRNSVASNIGLSEQHGYKSVGKQNPQTPTIPNEEDSFQVQTAASGTTGVAIPDISGITIEE